MESTTTTNPLLPLAGKKGLITGVANDKSIAYAVAKAARALGAEIALTYQNEKTAKYTQPLAEALDAKLFLKLDVAEPGCLEGVIAKCGEAFGEIDFAIHSMAFCNAEDLHGRVIDATEEGFDAAMNVSCHSFLRMAKALEPLMAHGGSLITMSYLGAERVVRNYGVMGVIKAALESLKKENGYLFEDDPPARYASGTGTQQMTGAVTKESFAKMGYRERLKIKQENPNLYEQVKE